LENAVNEVIIYHNPRCSKSRQALALLQDNGVQPKVVEYLKNPLTLNQLKTLKAHFDMGDFVRTNEQEFKNLGLSLDDDEVVLKAISECPKLMQRPIVVKGNKAIIGRPPENVMELI
jgi:arsenate reductase